MQANKLNSSFPCGGQLSFRTVRGDHALACNCLSPVSDGKGLLPATEPWQRTGCPPVVNDDHATRRVTLKWGKNNSLQKGTGECLNFRHMNATFTQSSVSILSKHEHLEAPPSPPFFPAQPSASIQLSRPRNLGLLSISSVTHNCSVQFHSQKHWTEQTN